MTQQYDAEQLIPGQPKQLLLSHDTEKQQATWPQASTGLLSDGGLTSSEAERSERATECGRRLVGYDQTIVLSATLNIYQWACDFQEERSMIWARDKCLRLGGGEGKAQAG